MPIEIRRSPARTVESERAPSIVPLAIAAVLAFVFHLVSGIMLDRSHASAMIEPAAFAASGDEAICPMPEKQPEQSLPFD